MGSPEGLEVGRGLFQAARWWEDGLLALVAEAGFPGVSRTQILLVIEVESGGTSASELARRLGVTRQSVHQDVRKLIAKDVVDQIADPGNRAAKRVVLTTQGERMLAAARDAQEALTRTLQQRLGPNRTNGLLDALDAPWGDPPAPSLEALAATTRETVAHLTDPEPVESAPESASAPAPEQAPQPDPDPEPAAEKPKPKVPSRPGSSGFAFPGLQKSGRQLPGKPRPPFGGGGGGLPA